MGQRALCTHSAWLAISFEHFRQYFKYEIFPFWEPHCSWLFVCTTGEQFIYKTEYKILVLKPIQEVCLAWPMCYSYKSKRWDYSQKISIYATICMCRARFMCVRAFERERQSFNHLSVFFTNAFIEMLYFQIVNLN